MKNNPVHSLRQFVRIPFDADVLLRLQGKAIKVQLIDISLKGALVQSEGAEPLQLQEKCRLSLPMAQDGEGIVMSGHIAHLNGQQIGMVCTDIDLTSLTRLRRLIELNSGDPQLMHREIRHLVEAH